MQTIKRNTLLWIAGLLMLAGVWQIGQGAYIHAKAQFAQYLMRKSWDKASPAQRKSNPGHGPTPGRSGASKCFD